MCASELPSHERLGRTGRGRTQPGLFLFAAAVSVLGLIGTYMYFVRTSTGQFIDESAWSGASIVRHGIGGQVSQFLNTLPAASVVISSVLVLLIVLGRRRWFAGLIAVATAVGANLSTQLLKYSLPERPDRGIQTLTLNSLPSGHTTLAASAVAAVFLVASPRWRPLIAFLGGSYAVISGAATLVNQWHRPADVVAAYLVVSAWTALGGWLILRRGDSWNVWAGYGSHWASSRLWPSLAALLGIAAALLSAATLLPLPSDAASQSPVNYFLVGVGFIVITGYLLCVAGTLLFGAQAPRYNRPGGLHRKRHSE